MTAKLKFACLAGALFAAASAPASAGQIVDAIKARGELVCGVNTDTPFYDLCFFFIILCFFHQSFFVTHDINISIDHFIKMFLNMI